MNQFQKYQSQNANIKICVYLGKARLNLHYWRLKHILLRLAETYLDKSRLV